MAISLEEAFEQINSRPLSDKQRKRMLKIQSVLELKDNDALMTALFALESYNGMYGEIPEKITAAVKKITDDAQTIAETKLQVLVNDIVDKISDEAAKAVNKIAAKKAAIEQWKWIVIASVLCSLSLLAAAGGGYWLGSKEKSVSYDAGYAAGVQSNHDAKAAAAWSNTVEGLMAYRLYRNGELSKLAHCKGKGWIIKNGGCYPYEVPGEGQYGWSIQ